MNRVPVVLWFAVLLTVFAVRTQESFAEQQDDTKGQSSNRTDAQKTVQRMPARGSGIVADNLDRVAATANQILEVVNRDAGLMVELKRVLAEDAGEIGQILEESDLSESAVTERLVEDLRSRVLATRLLQRYGYLLPKVNPDSDVAAEHNLEMRARAQQLERASESRDSNSATTQMVSEAEAPPRTEHPANQGRSTRKPLVTVDGIAQRASREDETIDNHIHRSSFARRVHQRGARRHHCGPESRRPRRYGNFPGWHVFSNADHRGQKQQHGGPGRRAEHRLHFSA
jgi:hypothetical protein